PLPSLLLVVVDRNPDSCSYAHAGSMPMRRHIPHNPSQQKHRHWLAKSSGLRGRDERLTRSPDAADDGGRVYCWGHAVAGDLGSACSGTPTVAARTRARDLNHARDRAGVPVCRSIASLAAPAPPLVRLGLRTGTIGQATRLADSPSSTVRVCVR